MICGPKAQGIQQCHWPRSHCEYVAEDPANTCRRTLIGLDVGGVIVALDLEDGGKTVTNIDGAGIFARPLDHLWAIHGKGFQPFL